MIAGLWKLVYKPLIRLLKKTKVKIILTKNKNRKTKINSNILWRNFWMVITFSVEDFWMVLYFQTPP
ncbi:unnamed protein product [Rhizophagus irregularis]|uniref:Uncharacterized protein n=1 Tax=Rhizophagus irregularis TaxID=588596 RepID=A0A916E6Y9_9GLOM|nr:unnamed protein product [Rhizophagus irregularis]CAB5364640.1 unnamed protein product [Rhizophagus irregularis]CAB5364641.1 unnamed protein product [Rhizophagus irregularis]